MLHVFSVNRGQMMTFDVALAMDKVINLKKIIGSRFSVDPETQVMLVNGGQELEDSTNVGTYAAGTETNPIFVYDRSLIDKGSIHISRNCREEDMSREIEEAYLMPASYETVSARTKLALRINEATQSQARALKSIIHDVYLMFHGWKHALANLSDTNRKFEMQIASTQRKCAESLEKLSNHGDALEGMEDVIGVLGQIKLLPALTQDDSSEMTLLGWIESRCRNLKLAETLTECREKLSRLKQGKLDRLLQECYKITDVVSKDQVGEISGVQKYLKSLDCVLITTNNNMEDQKVITKGFLKNKEGLDQEKSSLTRDALMTLCESHVSQLKLMHKKESDTRGSLMYCTRMKGDLATKLNIRLKWLYTIHHQILLGDTNLSMFRDQLDQTVRYVEFFSQVEKTPELYFASVHECARRRAFSSVFKQWGDSLLSTWSVTREKEIARRKKFKADIGQHFIKKLFPGFSDRPPAIAKRPLKSFDTELPEVADTDVFSLTAQFPQFKQPEVQVDPLLDTSQLPWQPYSTSFKASPKTSVIVTSSIDSTTSNLTISKISQATDIFKGVGSGNNDFSSGGFAASSIQKITDDENDDTATLKDFSPPSLSPIDVGGMESFESGEFFTMPPFLESQKMQPLSITPPGAVPASAMLPIPEMKHVNHTGSPCGRLSTQSQLTSSSASDDEMFHSIRSEMEMNNVTFKLKEVQSSNEVKDEEIKKLKKKYNEDTSSLQRSQNEMAAAFEGRLMESRNELENVLEQLARERDERRQAWEKESQTVTELKEQHLVAVEEINDLKKEISEKNRLLSEMNSQMSGFKGSSEIKIAEVEQRSEREIWTLKQSHDAELVKMTETTKNLERLFRDASSNLASAEDRIQELETQVSDAEAKISSLECAVETSAAEIEICQKDVARHQEIQEETATKLHEAEDTVAGMKLELDNSRETVTNLKGMLATYEVDLDDIRISNKLLQNNQVELEDIRSKNDELEKNLKQSQTSRLHLDEEIVKLKQELLEKTKQAEEHETIMKLKLEESQNHYENVILEIKDEAEQKNKEVFESNKKRMSSLKKEHDDELIQLKDLHEVEINKMKQSNNCEQDEMRADHLAEVVGYQQKVNELQQVYENQTDLHEKEMNELRTSHEGCITDLSKELNSAVANNSILQSKIDQWCVMNMSLPDSVLSSGMSSSNEETDSKRTRIDDEMMTSYKTELEKEKQALHVSYRKKEEMATKRRQVIFNSAIQRIAGAKDAEIERLKQQVAQNESMLSSVITQASDVSSASSSRGKEKEKVTVSNFQPDDLVLVIYDPRYSQYVLATFTDSLYFLHNDSVAQLDLPSSDSKPYTLARLLKKEYCLARKPSNRFRVDVGTKFYRVKLTSLSKPGTS